MVALCFSCKETGNNETTNVKKEDEAKVVKKSNFENSLLDYRTINSSFNEGYKFTNFGVKKNSNESFGFVLKLSPEVSSETVESYSVGFTGYSENLEKPFKFSSHPVITTKNDQNYVILNKKIPSNLRYFDSVELYIYKRKDWKSSGRIGGFKVFDILFEEK
jgi:hypothetical protein